MATNEIQNGCGSSIEAVRTSNQKRRRVYTSAALGKLKSKPAALCGICNNAVAQGTLST